MEPGVATHLAVRLFVCSFAWLLDAQIGVVQGRVEPRELEGVLVWAFGDGV